MDYDSPAVEPTEVISSPDWEFCMATRFRDFSVKEYWNLAWPFGCALLLGVLLKIVAVYWSLLDLVSMFGDAFIIAGTIGLILELFATRFLIEKVADDLSGRLVGKGLPSKLQAHIAKIARSKLVREIMLRRIVSPI